MLPLRFPRRWRIAGVLLLLCVLALALAPDIWPWTRGHGARWLLNDKALHGLTFFALAAWYSGQYSRAAYPWLAAGLLFFGALIEVCQFMLAYRAAEWADLAADAAGIAAGMIVALLGLGGWSLKVEHWMQARFG